MINRLALTILLLSLAPVNLAAAPDWNAILTSGPSKVPAPQEKVIWRSDLKASLLEAQSTGRPMFVTLRCLPCKQCSAFDKDVLEGGADLDPLLKQYITVRLTDANAADLRLLPVEGFQDLDLSWWGYFLSPQGEVYGIFGAAMKCRTRRASRKPHSSPPSSASSITTTLLSERIGTLTDPPLSLSASRSRPANSLATPPGTSGAVPRSRRPPASTATRWRRFSAKIGRASCRERGEIS